LKKRYSNNRKIEKENGKKQPSKNKQPQKLAVQNNCIIYKKKRKKKGDCQ
jgi:hypothetical protein